MSFVLPKVMSNGSHGFHFNGVKLWNSVPKSIRACDSKDKFKLHCKTFLMDRAIKEETSDVMYY